MINKVILVGNVGADPEIRTLESGVKVARLRVATTERMYNRETQEAKEHTEWHSITLWRNLADVADRFIRKGSQVYIEGRLRTREWTDAQGAKRYSVEIIADDLKMLGRKPEGAPAPIQPSNTQGGGQSYGQGGNQNYGQGGNQNYGQGAGQEYQQSAPAPQNYGIPSAPEVVTNEDPDDLPF